MTPSLSPAAAVSEAVSRLFLDKFGRGPMDIETFEHGSVMTTVMRDVFTTAERAMVDAGREGSVIVTRVQWQSATRELFKQVVSEATGRRVLTVVSGFDVEQDMATEVFVLAPA